MILSRLLVCPNRVVQSQPFVGWREGCRLCRKCRWIFYSKYVCYVCFLMAETYQEHRYLVIYNPSTFCVSPGRIRFSGICSWIVTPPISGRQPGRTFQIYRNHSLEWVNLPLQSFALNLNVLWVNSSSYRKVLLPKVLLGLPQTKYQRSDMGMACQVLQWLQESEVC